MRSKQLEWHKEQFQQHIHSSVRGHQSLLFLSNLEQDDRNALAKQLTAAWSEVTKNRGDKRVKKLHQMQMYLPWPEKATLSFFNKHIDLLGIERIGAEIRQAYKELEEFQSQNSIKHALQVFAGGNTYIANVLYLLQDNPEWYHQSDWDKKMRPQALQSFITDSCPRPTLDKLGIARNLTLEERFLLLQSIWGCLTGPLPVQGLEKHIRLWLWIDEVENILDYTEKDQREIVKGLTYLISSTGSYLTAWLNISAQSQQQVEAIKNLFGNRLLSLLDEDWTLMPLASAIHDESLEG